jgi:HJR/Mrr/RecB family endonuclease
MHNVTNPSMMFLIAVQLIGNRRKQRIALEFSRFDIMNGSALQNALAKFLVLRGKWQSSVQS